MFRNKINIGSCGFRKDGWLNLDKPSSHYSAWQSPIDIEHDLMTLNPICIRDECLDIAYTSHTIEHLSDEYVYHLFKEVHRILKKGGVFRITCPDIGKCYEAYKSGNKNYISKWKGEYRPFHELGIGEQFYSCLLDIYRHITKEKLKNIQKRKSGKFLTQRVNLMP
tara:strand:+ start:953 stop:1450 length:498 start_codon:yes stop_codon:yes gene_type:complete